MGLHDREGEGGERNRRVEKGRETFSSSVNELLTTTKVAFELFLKGQRKLEWFGAVP